MSFATNINVLLDFIILNIANISSSKKIIFFLIIWQDL